MTLGKMLPIFIGAAVIGCFSGTLTAQTTAPIITYAASGTFASIPISGQDQLGLAGEPFQVSIKVSTNTAPYQHGSNWDSYDNLTLKGVVHASVVGSAAEDIASNKATIIQSIDPGVDDVFTLEAPVKIPVGNGLVLTIKAVITLPPGTLTKPTLHPFNEVELTPSNSTVSVSYDGEETVLAVQTGTFTATIP